jgi:uncharacterized membrane-anchored protein
MKRIIAATLVAALIAPSVPAFAAESTATESAALERTIEAIAAAQPTPAQVSLRTSAKQAVGTDAAAYGPRSMPRQPNDGVRHQMGGGGGSNVGMIIGLISAVAGVAATVYMVKQMKKTTDNANKN